MTTERLLYDRLQDTTTDPFTLEVATRITNLPVDPMDALVYNGLYGLISSHFIQHKISYG